MNIVERHATVSMGISRVRGIVNRSPYPKLHHTAEHHLGICNQALRDAIVQSDSQIVERLFEISENELLKAEEAATTLSALQRKIVAEYSLRDTAFFF